MYKQKLILALFLISAFGQTATSMEITVGDRPIELPVPDGFVELTPDMSPYYESMQAYVAPTNIRYVTLIAADKAEAIQQGLALDLGRFMAVETERSISTTSVTSAHFAELRETVQSQITEAYSQLAEKIPELYDEGNKTLSSEFSADVAIQVGGMVPLPVHVNEANEVAYSMYLTVGGSVNNEEVVETVVAATVSFLHVKDKILFVYVYGPESDLDWTKEMSSRLATQVIAANPLTDEVKQVLAKSGSGRFDWKQVLKSGAIGALIGLAIFMVRRRKEQ